MLSVRVKPKPSRAPPPGSGAPSPRAPRSPSRTEFVSPSHLELWSSSAHRVRLGKYKRDADSLRREGENSQAVWSPDAKLIAVVMLILLLVTSEQERNRQLTKPVTTEKMETRKAELETNLATNLKRQKQEYEAIISSSRLIYMKMKRNQSGGELKD
ncbi:hypothetical protein NL676_039900 [Syzygium grande]|nr:hypothetical protein NL676_039900 [Syzygium grande]